jgi:hypothetical protein
MDTSLAMTPARRHGARAGRRGHRATPLIVAQGVLVVLLVASIAVSAASLLMRPATPQAPGWTCVSVDSHVTLWDLATTHPVDGLGVPATVELIRAENALGSTMLRVGQTLRVPAQHGPTTAVALQ